MIRTLLTRGAITLAVVSTAIAQVPVPQATYTTAQLYQPLRTFTTAEIGITNSWAAMHKGYMVVAGGRFSTADPTGYARVSTWRLSQAALPGVVNPSVVGTQLNDNIYKSHAMGFFGDKVQIREMGGISKFAIYDVSNMAAPTVTGRASGGVSSNHSTCWAGKYMYTGGEGYGTASGWIDIFDVSNPAAPVLKKSVDIPTITGFRCASVYVIGNLLVVSASLTNGIATFDLSDPSNPLLISVFRGDTGATTYTSYLSGNRLYGGSRDDGCLYIYDIQNPGNIQLVDRVNVGGQPLYPTVQDEYVHIGNGNGNYQKIHVASAPATIVANVPLPMTIEGTHPIPEVAIPIGNLVFIGTLTGAGGSGHSIANSAGWLIPHDTAPDTLPPSINAVHPQDGETHVAATSMIGVSFTAPLEGTSVNSGTVIVRPFGGSAIAGIYSDMNGIVNFTPSVPMLANTTYEVVVPAGGVTDTQGNAVLGGQVYRFSTGASVNTSGAGLVLYYPFDETSGTVADDMAGGNNGTLTNFPPTPSPWSQGLVGRGALTLDGVADYIITPSLNVGSTFSFSTWVWVNSGSTSLQTIVSNSSGGSTTTGFRFFVCGSANATPGRINFETGNGTGGTQAHTGNNVIPFNQWVHLGVTVDCTGGVARIYVNGTDLTVYSAVSTGFKTIAALTIGRMGTNTNYYFGGNLDDFRLYNRVLTSADFKQLIYLCGNPVGKWCFNSSTANDAPDGLPVALSTTGATYNTADSAEGAASLSLDGTSGYATAPSTDLGNGFAVAAWVKVTSGTSTLETIAANSNSGLNTAGWRLYATGSTNATPGRLILETGNGTSGIQVHTANNTLPYDTWAHVALMIDRTAGQSLIYVNGVDQTPAGTARTDFTTTGPIQFGRMADNLNLFKGSIDDIRIYPRLLTDPEIGVLAVGKLLAYWPFDSTGNDGSGFGRVATLQNGAGYTTLCVRGTDSLNLNGLQSDATAAAFDVGNTFSISMWAQLTTSAALSGALLCNNPGPSTHDGFRLYVNTWNTADGRIVLETGNGTLGNSATTSAGVFPINQWNHVAIVVNRTAGTASIYCNRQLVTTDTSIRTDFGTNLALYIGRLVANAPFTGQIDDLRIYNKLLSNTDIGALGDGSPSLPPTISSLASSSPAATDGTPLTFTATASELTVGMSLSYRFDFGDGNSTSWSPNSVANYTYSIPGRYVVTAFVSNGTSTVSTTTTQIVYNPPTATAPSISAEMAYDSSRNKVWVVVPDGDGSTPQGVVVRFDGITRTVDTRLNLGANSEPVALAIRPGNAEVWVANKNAGTVTIVDANTTGILTTLSMGRGSLPVGICFAPDGSAAFVACEGSEGVLKFNPATRAQTGVVDTGAAPRGIACTSDSLRLLVSRFRSPDTAGQVWEYSPAAIVLTGNASPVRTFSLNADTTTVDAEGMARGVPNYLSQVVISPDGMKAWLPAKKDNIFRGTFRDGQPLGHNNTTRSLIGQLSLITNAEISANRIDVNHTGFTVAGCFSPHGDLYFGAVIGNEAVVVIDANTRNTLPAISTATGASVLGYAPSGLCMSPDGSKLYVHNFLERTVRVFNVSALTAGTSTMAPPLLGTVNLITTEPLTATILQGKKVFYNSLDPRIASEGYIACASCHLGGDHDGRVWDITNFGEGLRNTIDLRGHAGMANGELHWSSNFNEVQDFDIQIRNLNGGSGLIVGTPYPPNGTTNVGLSADLDALAAYVTSLNVYPLSPFRNADGSMTASATSGAALFISQACNTCHTGTYLTDSTTNIFNGLVVHDIGTMTTASGQRLGGTLTGLDTPTLRGIWTTAPYLHRGQAADLPSVFNTTNAPAGTAHATFQGLNATQQQQLLDYLNEIE